MALGEIPRPQEGATALLKKAVQVLEQRMTGLMLSIDAFALLCVGIPEDALRAVAAVAEAAGDDEQAFLTATRKTRQWLTTMNGYYLDQYVEQFGILERDQQAHQAVVEEFFLLLGDLGYARLLAKEIVIRERARSASDVARHRDVGGEKPPVQPVQDLHDFTEEEWRAQRRELMRIDSPYADINTLYTTAMDERFPRSSSVSRFPEELDEAPPRMNLPSTPSTGATMQHRPTVNLDQAFPKGYGSRKEDSRGFQLSDPTFD